MIEARRCLIRMPSVPMLPENRRRFRGALWLAQQAPRASHMIEHVQFDTPNLQGEHLQFRRLDLRVLLNSVPPAAAIVMIADDATGGNRESPL